MKKLAMEGGQEQIDHICLTKYNMGEKILGDNWAANPLKFGYII